MEFLHHPLPLNHTPVTTPVPPKNAFAILTRLANFISRAKQDRVVLAQRILDNAWSLGSTRIGRVGWWLLTLGFRSFQRQARRCAVNNVAVEETPLSKSNWQHFSANASQPRAADSYIRNHQVDGGQYANAPHQLTLSQKWQIFRPECGSLQLNAVTNSKEPPKHFPVTTANSSPPVIPFVCGSISPSPLSCPFELQLKKGLEFYSWTPEYLPNQIDPTTKSTTMTTTN